MTQKLTILDLFAGAGGMSKGFIEAGFGIALAIENDPQSRQIYKSVIKSNNCIQVDLSQVYIPEIMDFDLAVAKIPYQAFQNKNNFMKTEKNIYLHYVLDIISKKSPKAFLLETTPMFAKSTDEINNFKNRITELGYDFSYTVIKTNEMMGIPAYESKLYIVGFRHDVQNIPFIFPERIVKQMKLEEVIDFSKRVEERYYRKNVIIENEEEIEKNTLYFARRNSLVRTERLRFNWNYSSYLIDNYGVRRITLNEIASFKGLRGIDFEDFRGKRLTERIINMSSNVYVIREIANEMRRYFGDKKKKFDEVDSSYLKRSISYPVNISEPMDIGNDQEKVTNSIKKLQVNTKIIKEYPKYNRKINSIFINKLKGLNNAQIVFDKPLTAIMGVNGSGKSTILHALACTFKSFNDSSEKYMFSDYFLPNPDSTWKGSNLSINYSYMVKDEIYNLDQSYKKDLARWFPRYDNRPDRDVYYIGISSCVPEIEKEKSRSYIAYTTKYEVDEVSKKVKDYARYILNKDYTHLTTHGTKHRTYMGVELDKDEILQQVEQEIAITDQTHSLIYSSLSMGTGEQRVFKILRKVLKAEKESLILIDEIELLLHIDALKKLIIVLDEIAKAKSLQIIFTTHSLCMQELQKYVDIRYLQNFDSKTMIYNNIDNDAIMALTGSCNKPIRVFVEDSLARGVVNQLLKELNMKLLVHVAMFGDARNAFVLAASEVIKDEDISNTLIIIDGDVYVTDDQKWVQIKSIFSGTEIGKDEKRIKALSLIKQFNLSGEKFPEKFIFNMLKSTLKTPNCDSEVQRICRNINVVDNSHSFINSIIERLDEGYDVGLREVLCIVQNSQGWQTYVGDIKEWFSQKKDEFSVPNE